jgi:hypothetical protein
MSGFFNAICALRTAGEKRTLHIATRDATVGRRADLMRLISVQRNQLILSSIRGADFLKYQTAGVHTSREGF